MNAAPVIPRPADMHRVLVVDDAEDVAEVISQMLGDAGLSTKYVCSGAEALAALEEGPYDVVVSDVRMPGISGIDVLREVKHRDRGKVVILVTGYDIGPLLRETSGYESVYVLRKPVSHVELIRVIEGALAERSAASENLRLRSLVHGLAEVNREADFQRGLDRILALATELTGAASGSIMLDDGVGELSVAAAAGASPAPLGARSGPESRSISWYVARTGTPVLVTPELKDHPVFGGLMRRPQIGSSMSLPLVHRADLLGVLNLNRPEGAPDFRPRDLDLARLMAEAVTLHVANLISHARTHRVLGDSDRSHLLGEMIAGLEHELRNPIAAISGYAQLLHARREPQRADEHLARLMNNVGRVEKILETLRSSYTHEARAPVAYDVNATLEDTVRYVRFQNPTNLVEVELDLDRQVPPVMGVEDEIMQVFVNLLNNALQAVTGRGVVRVASRREAGAVLITVTDSGCGIEQATISKIFEPFFTTRRGSGGTGLGLAITRTLVTRNGGTIDVESEPSRGATFRLRLPACTAPAEA